MADAAGIAREELILLLREVSDLERVMARIVTGTCNCRDFRQLSNGAARLPEIKAALGTFQSGLFSVLFEQLDDLADLKAEIDRILEELRQNGKLAELSVKYFGEDLTKKQEAE